MQIWKLLIRYLLFFIILSSPLSFAKQNQTQLLVFHINGINTSYIEAINNRIKLESASNISYSLTQWKLLYNETHGLLKSDIYDVLRQKKQEYEKLDIYDFVDAYMEQHHLHYEFLSREYKKLVNNLKELYAQDMDFVGINFEAILKQYHDHIAANANSIVAMLNDKEQNKMHMALFISHSQGALYTNSLIKYIIDGDKYPARLLGVYAIASPAASIGTSEEDDAEPVYGAHLTANNDFVINALRMYSGLSPRSEEPLYANFHLDICHDRLCHGLVPAYLANIDAVKMIRIYVNKVIWRLTSNLDDYT